MLPADEAEFVAELQDEFPHPVDEAVLELTLLHRAPDAEELQIVGTLERFIRLLHQMLRQRNWKVVHLAVLKRSLVRLRLDLIEQHVAAPAESRGRVQVMKASRRGACLIEDLKVMSPWDFREHHRRTSIASRRSRSASARHN